MKINEFVYSLTNGLGIVREVYPNADLLVSYGNGIEAVEEEINLYAISRDLVDAVITEKWYEYVPAMSVERGTTVYDEGLVLNTVIMDSNITASVMGSQGYPYKVTISVSKRNLRGSCSCPVNAPNCKHVAAVMLSVQNKMQSLLESRPKAQGGTHDLKSYFDAIGPKISNKISLNALDELGNYLSDHEVENMEGVLKDLEVSYDRNIVSKIVPMLYFNKNTSACFDNYVYDYSMPTVMSCISRCQRASDIKRSVKNREYNRITRDPEIEILAYISNQMYLQLFVLVAVSNAVSLYADFCFKHAKPDKKLADHVCLKPYMRGRGFSEEAEKAVFAEADDEVKKYIIETYEPDYLTTDDILNLSTELQLKCIKNFNSAPEAMSLIASNFEVYESVDPVTTYEIVINNYIYGYVKDKKQVYNRISDNSMAVYIKAILDNKLHLESNIGFLPKAFFKYFQVSYTIIPVEYKATVHTSIEVMLDEYNVMSVVKENDKVSVSSRFSDETTTNLSGALFEYLYQNDPEFKKQLEEAENKIIHAYEIKKKQEYLDAFQDFSEDSFTPGITLSNKIGLEYEFSSVKISYKNLKNVVNMSLHVGQTKYYIVKNVKEFLLNVENGRTVKYGKELEFSHDIENFREEDKKILNYLLSLPYDYFDIDSARWISLPVRAFETMLEMLKGRIITCRDEKYKVTLNKVKSDIYVSEDYHLHSSLDQDSLLRLKNIYYLDKDTHEILMLDAKPEELKLIQLVNEHPNMDLSLVRQEFVDEIYSRCPNAIAIPERLKPDFKLNLIRIDAYFDYQHGVITLDTKIYKDDVLLTSEAFMNGADKERFARYTSYILKLGFEDKQHLTDNSLILQFFTMDFTELNSLCNVYLSDTIKNKSVAKIQPPQIRIQYENNMMQVFMEKSEYDEKELAEIMKAIRQKKNFVLLDEDHIVELDSDEAEEFYDTVMDLRLDLKNPYQKQPIPTYDALKAYAHEKNVEIDEYIAGMVEELSDFKKADISLPKLSDGTKLRPYQEEGFKWLSILSKYRMGGILADDMGLGKTLEIITLIESDPLEKPSLIVCPKSLIFNWYSEFEKFTNDRDVRMVYGNQTQRHNLIRGIHPEKKVIYVTAYDSLRMDAEYYEDAEFNYLIIDEAQAIKNVTAQKSLSVKTLNGIHRFALSGTPIENNIIDLWSIFDFIMPGYLNDLSLFKGRYLSDESYTKAISKKVAPFILRRTKSEVLKDLPPKYERIISVDMTSDQRKIYDAHIQDAAERLDAGTSIEILSYLTRLRQICVDPKLFIGEYSSDSGKMDYLKEMIPEYIQDGHRILIFSSFVKALGVVSEILNSLGIRYLVLTGDTKAEERSHDTALFNSDTDIKVYLISLKAGGTGLNLTGADTVIHLDPWWNVSAENQASDRAHRIGQRRNVEVIKLVASQSVEERVIELQNIKKDIIDKVISDNDSSVTSLSLDDLKFILS